MKTPIRHSIRFAIAAAAAVSIAVPTTASAETVPTGAGSQRVIPAAQSTQPDAATKALLRKQVEAKVSGLPAGKTLRSSATKGFTYYSSGRPGNFTAYRVQASHYRNCTGMYCPWNPSIAIPGPMLYRSPATSGAQDVLVRYIVQRWSGPTFGWGNLIVKDAYQTIWAGSGGVRFNQEWWVPTQAGHLRVVMVFAWASRSGTGLGSRLVNMNHAGDYQCATRISTCVVNNGWVYIAAPGT